MLNGPDAELIALCDRYVALERGAWFRCPETGDLERDEVGAAAARDTLALVVGIEPTTADGAKAMARAALARAPCGDEVALQLLVTVAERLTRADVDAGTP
jgi:hypothetical protein